MCLPCSCYLLIVTKIILRRACRLYRRNVETKFYVNLPPVLKISVEGSNEKLHRNKPTYLLTKVFWTEKMHVEGLYCITLPVWHRGWDVCKLSSDFWLPFQEYHGIRPLLSEKKCFNYTSWTIKAHLVHKYPVISSGNPCTLRKWHHETFLWWINLCFIHPVAESLHTTPHSCCLTTVWSIPKLQYLDFNRPGTSLYYEFLHIE
jgi:hypothetical protein